MKAVVCHQTELAVADLPDPVPGPGQVLLEVSRAGICGSDLHARRHADQLADLASAIGYHDVMRPDEHVVMGHEFSGRVAGLRPGDPKRLGCRDAGGVAADDPDGRQGADDRPVGQGARGVRRAGAGPGVPDDGRAQRAGARDGGPDRADGGRLARRTTQRGAQAGDGRGRRVWPDRAGRDPDAQGARRPDGDRQRLLAGPPCPRRGVRRRRRDRPRRRVAVDRLRAEPLHHRRQPALRPRARARWASCAGCRCCRGGRCSAPPRPPARPRAGRSCSSASACPGSSTTS